MPAEVISLLSSPEPEPASPPSLLEPSPRPPKPSIPARRLNYDDDPFEDAGPTSTARAPPKLSASPSASRVRTLSGRENISFLESDDFDDTGIISWSEADKTEEPAPKRQRLSPVASTGTRQDNVVPQRSLATAGLPPPKSITLGGTSKRQASLVEEIDLSSPPRLGKISSKRTGPPPDSDPFASSSPRNTGKESPKARHTSEQIIIDDDDNADDVGNDDRGGGLFMSSSPVKEKSPRRSPKRAGPVSWDPISSSAPQLDRADDIPARSSRPLQRSRSEVITLDDSDDSDESIGHLGGSDDEFPDVDDFDADKIRGTLAKTSNMTTSRRGAGASASRLPGSSKSVVPKKSAEEKEREKEEKIAAREAEKERKRVEKEVAKEKRVKERQQAAALAELNKLRTKKDAAPEMIVDLPSSLHPATRLQAETLLEDMKVEVRSWSSTVDNVVRWRRKVKARYDMEMDRWDPVPEHIETETHVAVVLPAAEFAKLVVSDEERSNLEAHVLRMQTHFPNQTIIYLIEGLKVFVKKNQNLRNRQFTTAVRAGLEPEQQEQQSGSSNRRRNNDANQGLAIDEDMIEDALMQLQVLHGALIHHTVISAETAHWIAVFTEQISMIPYKRKREEANDDSAGFCMESGQVRSGDSPQDTYVRLLEEITGVTASIAWGIAAQYKTLPELVEALETEGPLCLEALRRASNKDGAFSNRAIGPALSKRIHKILTGQDPMSTDI